MPVLEVKVNVKIDGNKLEEFLKEASAAIARTVGMWSSPLYCYSNRQTRAVRGC